MNSVFRTFLGVAWGGPNRSYKTLVHACSTTKCNAHDKGYPGNKETCSRRIKAKLAASRGVPRITLYKMPITR
jgi:hypothetical protein